jgi:CBS domain-containing protein
MRVQDVMTKNLKAVSPLTTADDAWNMMRSNRIHHLVVVKGPLVMGIFSDRDAGGHGGASGRENSTVADLMTAPAVVVQPTTTVRKAANLMRGRSIGCLVVVKDGRAVGIVIVSDLLELVGRGLDRGAVISKRWTLKHRTPHDKSNRSAHAW